MKDHAFAVSRNGYHTDIAVKVYSNRIFLIVTDFKKIGTLICINRQSPVDCFSSNIYSTKVIFGNDDVGIVAAARFIAEQIDIDRPLLISLSLKEYSGEILKPIISAINQRKIWNNIDR